MKGARELETPRDDEARAAGDAFARLMTKLDPDAGAGLATASRLAVEGVMNGHACVELDALPSPDRDAVVRALNLSRLVSRGAGPALPLVLENGRLYLRRYWIYEREIAASIRLRALNPGGTQTSSPVVNSPANEAAYCDEGQMEAVRIALGGRFALVSGGPGTGKTTIIAELMLQLAARTPGDATLAVAMAAPTGKAAHRMGESLSAAFQRRGAGEAVRRLLPREAMTLHRLLGIGSGSPTPCFHADNPLGAELVVVDEASMIDLPAMARLLAAMRPSAQLVLVGDAQQLASVEVGTVFADLVEAGQAGGPLAQCTAVLGRTYRFEAGSAIHAFCEAVRSGDWPRGRALLSEGAQGLSWSETLGEDLDGLVLSHFRAAAAARTPEAALDALRKGRILCGVRAGPSGVRACNRLAAALVRVSAGSGKLGFASGDPVIVTRNDPAQHLYNGDTGVFFHADEGDRVEACFQGPDGVRRISPLRLPPHEPAFAISIHRSQGSEYDDVLIILPEAGNRILSRELLYTAASRARRSVRIAATAGALEQCFRTPIARASGLADRLRDNDRTDNLFGDAG